MNKIIEVVKANKKTIVKWTVIVVSSVAALLGATVLIKTQLDKAGKYEELFNEEAVNEEINNG